MKSVVETQWQKQRSSGAWTLTLWWSFVLACLCVACSTGAQTAWAKADLSMQSWSSTGSATGFGSSVVVTFRVSNSGDQDAGRFIVSFYYADTTSPSGLVKLNDTTITSLAKGRDTGNRRVSMRLPNSVLFGSRALHYTIDSTNQVSENSESNNRGVRPLLITGQTNLRVVSLRRFPGTQTKGGQLNLSYRIFNDGYSRLDNVVLRFVYSTDRTITLSDTKLLDITVSLPARSYHPLTTNGSVTVTLPSSITTGVRYVGLYVDATNKVNESNENDNGTGTAFTVTSTAPELSIRQWSFPSSARGTGTSITLSYELQNTGTAEAKAFYVAFYYGDSTATNGLTFLTNAYIASVGAGKRATFSRTLTLPGNVLFGQRYLHAVVDYTNRINEINENNNRAVRGLNITGRPNLQISYLLRTPSTQVAGGELRLDYRIFNAGYSRIQTPFETKFYDSADATITTSDTDLQNSRIISALFGQRTISGVATLKVPSNVSAGLRYVGMITDVANKVVELDENDNKRSLSFTVTTGMPDLLLSNWNATTSANGAGSQVTVEYQVKNQGQRNAGSFDVSFYYGDSTSTSGLTLLGKQTVSSLKANTTASKQTLRLTLPNNVLSGTRAIHAFVDSSNKVAESSETNNRSHKVLTLVGKPNLYVSLFAPSPTSQVKSGYLTLRYRVTNNGTTRATSFYLRFYYSADSTVTTSDTYMGQVYVRGLNARTNQPSTGEGNLVVRIPSNAASGRRYLGAIVDVFGRVTESNERDNTRTTSFTITSSAPDLSMATWTAPRSAPGYRSQVKVTYQIRNTGSADAGRFEVAFYYGDSTSTSGLLYLGQGVVSGVGKGKTATGNVTLTLPNRVLFGSRYLHYVIDYRNRVSEISELNNRSYRSLYISGTPNLQISVLSRSPSSQVKGGQMQVYYRIVNAGVSRIPTTVTSRLYYSTDATISTRDVYLNSQHTVSQLYAGASTNITATVTLPTNATPGTRYIGAYTDIYNRVRESSESDNTRSTSVSVISAIADLRLSTWSAPSSLLGAGSQFNVTFRVANTGGADARAYSVAFYYGDATSTSRLTYLGRKDLNTGLKAKTTSPTQTLSLTLPNTVLYGKRYLHYIVDVYNRVSESNETNNRGYRSFSVTGKPDLQISAFLAKPTTQTKGGQVFLTYRITNAGYSRIPSFFTTRFYYSADATITNKDVYLGRAINLSTLYARTSYPSTQDAQTNITLPNSVLLGTRYVGAIIDDGNRIDESLESNNTRSAAITVTGSNPDLEMATWSVTQSVPGAGSKVTVRFQVRNRGTADAAAFDVAFYYGDSTSTSPTRLRFLGRTTITSLKKASSTTTLSAVLILPKIVSSGRRYIHAHIDYLDKVAELSETNNRRYASFTITGKPNLKVAFLGVVPTSQIVNGQLTVYYRVSNTGATRASGFYLRFYYSTDSSITTRDTVLGRTIYVPFVDVGGFSPDKANGEVTLTVPRNASLGTRYVGAIVDYSGRVAEGDEKDNTRAVAFNVVNKIADLYMASVTINSSGQGVGSPLTVLYQVRNRGTANATGFRVAFYYGNSTTTTKLTYLGQVSISGLKINTSTPIQGVNFKLPSSVQPGTGYLHYHIDFIGDVPESYESNNRGYRSFTVTGKPDLQATTFTINPQTQAAGQALTVNYRLSNPGATRASGFYLRFYYSEDATITTSDTPLRDIFVTEVLAKGQYPASTNGSVTLVVPTTAKLGSRYIGLVLDSRSQVSESNEGNNTKVVSFTVAPQLPDLVVSQLSATPRTQQTGKSITVSVGVTNRGTKDAAGSRLGIYISTDSTITAADTRIGTITVPALSVGKVYQGRQNLTLPTSLTAGNRFIGAWVDDNTQIKESNDTNNTNSTSLTLLVDKDRDGVTNDRDCNDNDKDVYPGAKERCDGKDNNCDKKVDEGCTCVKGTKRACYSGGQGCTKQSDGSYQCTKPCQPGTQTCTGTSWGACTGEVASQKESCNGKDDDCDGKIDQGLTRACYGGPSGTAGQGECKQGTQRCTGGRWDKCQGAVEPAKEDCNGKDDDCDGQIDNQKGSSDTLKQSCSSPCGQGQESCVRGKWQNCTAPASCSETPREGGESSPEGETSTDAGPDAGEATPEISPESDCYITGCPAKQLCVNGQCVADPCDTVGCPSGQFCRQGQCVGACGCTSCQADERCVDGTCRTDACANVSCSSGEICDPNSGQCVTDPCANVNCGTGRVCQGGQCIDDPCNGVICPQSMQCQNGQCVGQNCGSERGEQTPDGEASQPEPADEVDTNTEQAAPDAATTDSGNTETATDRGETATTPDLVNQESTPELQSKEASSTPDSPTQKPDAVLPPEGCGCNTKQSSTPFQGLLFVLCLGLMLTIRRRKQR